MAENLGDPRQRHPGVGQLTSQGVAEPVGPNNRHSRPRTGAANYARDPIRSQWPNWGNSSQEHLPMHGDLRAAPPQIRDDRLADVARQREAVLVTSLAVHHDLAGPPVDVIEAEAGDLAGAQPEAKQDE